MSKYINALNALGDCKFCKKRETCTERRGRHLYCWEIDEKFTAELILVLFVNLGFQMSNIIMHDIVYIAEQI